MTRYNVFMNTARQHRDAFARNGNDTHITKAEALEAKARAALAEAQAAAPTRIKLHGRIGGWQS